MIGVQPVPAPRVMTEDNIGSDLSDPVGYLPALANPGFELAVRPAEEGDVTVTPECPRRRSLLFLPHGDQRGEVGVRVPRSFGAIGADEVMNVAAIGSPLRQRCATAKLDVVGMGADG